MSTVRDWNERLSDRINLRTPSHWTSIYPIHVEFNAVHWGFAPWTPNGAYDDGSPRYSGVQHDEAPRTWPWWRLVSFCLCDVGDCRSPWKTTGKRLWIYTRWGSLFADYHIDRRER